MASRRPSSYDPYAYHHAAAPSYRYTYLYDDPYGSQRRRPAATYGYIYDHDDDPHHGGRSRLRGSRRAGDPFFPAAWHAAAAPPEAEAEAPGAAPANPIQIEGLAEPEPEPDRERETGERRAEEPAPPVVVSVKRAPLSAEEAAAVRVQAAARGFLARRSVRAVRRVEREVAAVGRLVRQKAEALRANARARLAAGEVLMKMLLRLDAVRGAREYRRKVTRRVLALQDAVDALDPNAPPAAEAESAAAPPEPPDAAENGGETGSDNVVGAHAKMEVDAEANVDGGDTEGPDAEGEWEMVAEEPAAVASAAAACPEVLRQESSGQGITAAAEAGADASKLTEMVAALCEQNAQQRAVIAALAERVDTLERTVRRMEAAER
ncbi:unnamed protein product [Urochloa humidicola]